MRRTTAAIAATAMLVAACGATDTERRIPVGQGWVVDHEQSSDLRYDWDEDRIVSGSVDVVLADGTRAVVSARTDLESICQELLPPPAVTGPCWLQVGSPAEGGHAGWAVVFALIGDSGGPETVNQDHSFYESVETVGGQVVEVTDAWIIFSSGRAVTRGATDPIFEPVPLVHGRMADCPVNSIEDLAMLDETTVGFNAILDIDSGEVTELRCWEDT